MRFIESPEKIGKRAAPPVLARSRSPASSFSSAAAGAGAKRLGELRSAVGELGRARSARLLGLARRVPPLSRAHLTQRADCRTPAGPDAGLARRVGARDYGDANDPRANFLKIF